MPRKSLRIVVGLILWAFLPVPVTSSQSHQLNPVTEKTLYFFAGGLDGFYPASDLTLDREGNLYGTTYYGGRGCQDHSTCGEVFELAKAETGWKKQTLYAFKGGADGGNPEGGVIFDSAGNLYGTTQGLDGLDGSSNTVFKLSPNGQGGWNETVLYDFPSAANVQCDLTVDGHGDLFGYARNEVFELVPQPGGSWKESTIYQFNGGPTGVFPTALVLVDEGDMYGMTGAGGTGRCNFIDGQGCGIVFKLTRGSDGNWTEAVLYDFVRGGGNGVTPSGALILDNANRLIGTTTAGGNGVGTVFELLRSPQDEDQIVLHRFYGPDGADPVGKFLVGGPNVVFGVTSRGGSTGGGTVFALQTLAAGNTREKVLHSFGPYSSTADGSSPQAGLVADSQGNLYGTTEEGGNQNCLYGCGTVYEITAGSLLGK